MLRKKVFVIGLSSLAIIAGIFLLIPRRKPLQYVSSSGITSALEDYAFSAKPVAYNLPASFWHSKVFRSLPKIVKQVLPRSSFAVRNVSNPLFPGEPILSCAFRISVPNHAPPIGALRIVTADENGNEFDPVGQSAGMIGENPIYWATEVPAFPRRGQRLTLKLKQNGELLAEFKIPNPAPGPHPKWKPTPLPVVCKSNDLEVTLTDFRTQFQSEYTTDHVPSTICSFQVSQMGNVTTNWSPKSAEISDSTGNHWPVFLDRRYSQSVESTQTVGFLGALWSGEDAWKLQVGFEKQTDFDDQELIRFVNLGLPKGTNVTKPYLIHERDNIRLELTALLGPYATHSSVEQLNPNIWPASGTITIVMRGELLKNGRALQFVSLTDEPGRSFPLYSAMEAPGSANNEAYVPYTLRFKIDTASTNLTLLLAAPKIRNFTFVAKPRNDKPE